MRRTLVLRFSAGIFFLIASWIAYTQSQGQAPSELKLNQVKGDLYEIEGDGGNVAVYLTEEGVILVDDKYERDYADIMARVKSLTDKPVRYVLNTHLHGDHTGGNAKLLLTAEIFAQSNVRVNMTAQKMPGIPRVTFKDELELVLGGKEVRARYFGRGHTNGDAMIYFPALRVVHTGDLFTRGVPFIDYSSGGSAVAWTQTLDNLLASDWDFDTVIPGHGPLSKKEDLLKYRSSFEIMRNKISTMVRDGKSKDEVSKTLISDFGWAANGNGIQQIDAMLAELKR